MGTSAERDARAIIPPVALSDRAGQPADPATLVDVDALITAYFERRPDPADPAQRVAFGTSGHRGAGTAGRCSSAETPTRCRSRRLPLL
jgi:hypothetical protein